MRVVVNKESEIGEILAAVYYKSPIMPLDVPNLWNTLDSTTQTLLRSPKSLIPGMAQEIRYDSGELGVDYRFFEYGLQYFPNPEGILPAISEDMAKTLFWKDGKWVGTKEFKNLGKHIIFGNSLSSGDTASGIKFFGSFKSETQEIYVFPASSGISKIELYDTPLSPDEEIYDYDLGYQRSEGRKPVISIYLGCSDDLTSVPIWSGNIGPDYCIGSDIQRDIDLDYRLYSERFDDKVVFLSISQRNEKTIKVSYNAWLRLSTPLREKPSYDVLEGEKNIDPPQIGETIEGHIFDLASGSYLGKKVDSKPRPILEEKLKNLSLSQGSRIYNRWRRYKAGEEVKYGDYSWVSLCSDNCGNVPGFSSKWVLKDSTTNFYTSWFIVRCRNSQEILPGSKIEVPDYIKESVFKIYPSPGYIPTEDKSIRILNSDNVISRAVMTENVDIDEKRYYIFYIKWNPDLRDSIRGKVLDIELEKKSLNPSIFIPDFVIQGLESSGYILSWNNKLNISSLEVPEKPIVIDESIDVSILDIIRKNVTPGTGLNKKTADTVFEENFIEKLEFSLKYKKSIPGKTWETGESEVEPKVISYSDASMISDVILHEDSVDYEECEYILVPSWSYRKVTVSNSGDFDIEFPVLDIIRTEDYRSGVYSRTGIKPSEIMVKYKEPGMSEYSSWQHIPYSDGPGASWYFGDDSNRNAVYLTGSGENLYELQVKSVTIDLIIDIKV